MPTKTISIVLTLPAGTTIARPYTGVINPLWIKMLQRAPGSRLQVRPYNFDGRFTSQEAQAFGVVR